MGRSADYPAASLCFIRGPIGLPRWRALGNVDWRSGPLVGSYAAQYIGSYTEGRPRPLATTSSSTRSGDASTRSCITTSKRDSSSIQVSPCGRRSPMCLTRTRRLSPAIRSRTQTPRRIGYWDAHTFWKCGTACNRRAPACGGLPARANTGLLFAVFFLVRFGTWPRSRSCRINSRSAAAWASAFAASARNRSSPRSASKGGSRWKAYHQRLRYPLANPFSSRSSAASFCASTVCAAALG